MGSWAWQIYPKKFGVSISRSQIYTLYYRMFPPAIDIISTSLAVAYSDGKYTNKKLKRHHVTYSPTSSIFLLPLAGHEASLAPVSKFSSNTSLSVWIRPVACTKEGQYSRNTTNTDLCRSEPDFCVFVHREAEPRNRYTCVLRALNDRFQAFLLHQDTLFVHESWLSVPCVSFACSALGFHYF